MEDQRTGFELIIRDKNDDEWIKLDDNKINGYKFVMNSSDGVTTKDSDIMVELHIKGTLESDDDEKVEKLIKWSSAKASETKAAYKKLELNYIEDGVIRRQFLFPNAFVVDFVETFKFEKDNHGEERSYFVLFIKQNKKELKDFQMHTRIAIEG